MNARVTHQPPESAILFEDLVPGQEMGQYTLKYDEKFVHGWQHIAGSSPETQIPARQSRAQAASVSLMLMMRAFLIVVRPRPPGNIHARQSLSFCGLPAVGDELSVSVTCLAKKMHKGRRYVEFAVQAVNQRQEPTFQGMLTLIWAA